jgi:hypothetical protein
MALHRASVFVYDEGTSCQQKIAIVGRLLRRVPLLAVSGRRFGCGLGIPGRDRSGFRDHRLGGRRVDLQAELHGVAVIVGPSEENVPVWGAHHG